MAAPPATPHAAESRRRRLLPFPPYAPQPAGPSMHLCPTHSDPSFLLSFRFTQRGRRRWPHAPARDPRGAWPPPAPAAAHRNKLMGSLTNAEELRFGVVVARFNEVVTNLLLQGALETFDRYSVKPEDITLIFLNSRVMQFVKAQKLSVGFLRTNLNLNHHYGNVVSVPGSFEVPITAQQLGNSGKFDAILCIGAVIRGDTTHYDAVANSAASGVLNAGLSAGIPCIFGVLTCEDMDQVIHGAKLSWWKGWKQALKLLSLL
ncbi:hypothetical protein C2845_PM05G15230 [Panicum miliaceum]|uniref:6,7-dimethyl-8-ribityllumazine synthase n=1 Tax=Panicum miliaceum TaxID=4540 RepID=A0A3L6T2J1_PANMI|nr:hypothetical protein C2845_PM05G15230 [Panicum miliaceum]